MTGMNRRQIVAGLGALPLALGPTPGAAETIDRVNFLVGFGVGGGFDQTARGTQEALQKSGLIANATVENRTGGGGSVAIAHLIETAARQQNTLMVNGTSIVVRSLAGEFRQTFRDVQVVNTITAEIFGILVAPNAPWRAVDDLTGALRGNARAARFGGGSPRGGIDHLAAAKYVKEAGVDPRAIQYIAYDGGGRAMAGLLGGEVTVLVMPFTEALTQVRGGQVRLLAIMSSERARDVPDVPTLEERGVRNAAMYNVRAFFMAPGTPQARIDAYADVIERLIRTPAWEEVRARNAWNMFFRRGAQAQAFFEGHERDIRALLVELGFIQA
jgi:putative tricarboxylic transport membrane protein